jgi:hypothetical protein
MTDFASFINIRQLGLAMRVAYVAKRRDNGPRERPSRTFRPWRRDSASMQWTCPVHACTRGG